MRCELSTNDWPKLERNQRIIEEHQVHRAVVAWATAVARRVTSAQKKTKRPRSQRHFGSRALVAISHFESQKKKKKPPGAGRAPL